MKFQLPRVHSVDAHLELCDCIAYSFDHTNTFVTENHIVMDVMQICPTNLFFVLEFVQHNCVLSS